jgi:ATP-dependent DNA ligase
MIISDDDWHWAEQALKIQNKKGKPMTEQFIEAHAEIDAAAPVLETVVQPDLEAVVEETTEETI